ncbi:MAG TPA: hypothetical protein D7H79_03795 [Candidatus Poseidoniales archaeon]|nr:MAG TPA: hypothetical protein D7H79_03795 [Candidatus Poseidoniales archaeon]
MYSDISTAGIEFRTERSPSVRKASICPLSGTSIMCLSDKAGRVTCSPSLTTLAGRVYSAITSFGEKGAM